MFGEYVRYLFSLKTVFLIYFAICLNEKAAYDFMVQMSDEYELFFFPPEPSEYSLFHIPLSE